MFLTKDQYEEEIKRWENRLVRKCTKCNGLGSVPTYGGVNKMCSCVETAMLYSNLIACGVPRKYLTWNWDDCTPTEALERCKSYADNFIDNYYDGKGMFLYGCQGRGKSTMEALIARDVAMKINPDTNKHFKVMFIIYEELVQISHQSRQDRQAKYQLDTIINEPNLLIIDNVGSETGLGSDSKHTTRLLEFILRKRDNDCSPTMLSSNFTLEEINKNYNDIIHDFIKQNYDIVSVMGDNFRKQLSDVSSMIDEFNMEDF